MTARRALVLLGVAMAALSPVGSYAQAPDARPRAAEPATSAPSRYEAKGRRDPFRSLETASKTAPPPAPMVAAARLKGIVRGSATRALLETPDGVGYIMQPGDVLGNGRLIEIGADRVIFRVPPRQGSTSDTFVLRLSTE